MKTTALITAERRWIGYRFGRRPPFELLLLPPSALHVDDAVARLVG